MSLARVNNLDTDIFTSPQAIVLPPTGSPASNAVMPQPPAWPTETELHFSPGSTKIILTGQQPIVHLVVVDGIDNVHVSLAVVDAFPDAARTLEFVQDGLLTAAARRGPTAAAVLKRLQEDKHYYSAISPLVSTNFLRIISLTFFEVVCAYPNFQGQNQRVLQGNHIRSIRGYVFALGSGADCPKSTIKLQLHIPAWATKGKWCLVNEFCG